MAVRSKEIQAALSRVLSSNAFLRRQRPGELLRYLVKAELEGRRAEIKETTVALEFLRRRSDFDPKVDPAVRVLATRLRQGLREYYSQEGAEDPCRIVLPTGGYVPLYRTVSDAKLRSSSELVLPAPKKSPPPSDPVRTATTTPKEAPDERRPDGRRLKWLKSVRKKLQDLVARRRRNAK